METAKHWNGHGRKTLIRPAFGTRHYAVAVSAVQDVVLFLTYHFVFPEKILGHGVQLVRPQPVPAPDDGEHIKQDPPRDDRFLAIVTSVSLARELATTIIGRRRPTPEKRLDLVDFEAIQDVRDVK